MNEFTSYEDQQSNKNYQYEKELQNAIKNSTNPKEKELLQQSLRELREEKRLKKGYYDKLSHEGMSVQGTQGRQEPSAQKMFFGDNGEHDFADNTRGTIDRRRELIKECNNDEELDFLIESFVQEELKPYGARVVMKLVQHLHSKENPILELQIITQSCGMDFVSGEILAKLNGCTRQAISSKKQSVKAKLNLPEITRDSKSKLSRDKYKNNFNTSSPQGE
jgi:hypothetical protein